MRRHAHQRIAGAGHLTRAQAILLVGGAALLPILLATGGAGSPLLPVAVAWYAYATSRRTLLRAVGAPLAFTALLLLGDHLLRGLTLVSGVALAGALLVGSLAGGFWRRERRAAEADRDSLLRVRVEVEAGAAASLEAIAALRTTELESAVEDFRERAGARRVILWSVDAEGEAAAPRAVAGGTAPRRADLRGDPLGWVWQEGRGTSFDAAPYWGLRDTRPIVLRVRTAPGGLLLSYEFGAETRLPDPEALEGAAAGLNAVVGHLEARAAAIHERKRLRYLLNVLEALPRERDLPSFAQALLDSALTMAEATGGALALWHGDHGQVVHRVGEDGGPALDATFEALTSEMGLAVRAGGPLRREPYAPRRGGPAVAAPGEIWAARPHAVVVVPMIAGEDTAGVLAVWSSRNGRLADGSVDLLQALAPHAALLLTSVLEYGRLRERSERDPLTDLRNRRALDAALVREIARARRYQRSLAVVALDIDHFKAVNDRHGHAAGDQVLRRVAALLADGVRDIDVAARAGGEEFILLLPETNAAAAREVAERIRLAVAGETVAHEELRLNVRISAGVAAWPESVRDPALLLEAADAALYASKHAGRDRVTVAPAQGRGLPGSG